MVRGGIGLVCAGVLLVSGCDDGEDSESPITLAWERDYYEIRVEQHVPTHFILDGMLPSTGHTLWFEIDDDRIAEVDAQTLFDPEPGTFEIRIYCSSAGMTGIRVAYGDPGADPVIGEITVSCV